MCQRSDWLSHKEWCPSLATAFKVIQPQTTSAASLSLPSSVSVDLRPHFDEDVSSFLTLINSILFKTAILALDLPARPQMHHTSVLAVELIYWPDRSVVTKRFSPMSVELHHIDPTSVMAGGLLAQALTSRSAMDGAAVAGGDYGALLISLDVYDPGTLVAGTSHISRGRPLSIMQTFRISRAAANIAGARDYSLRFKSWMYGVAHSMT